MVVGGGLPDVSMVASFCVEGGVGHADHGGRHEILGGRLSGSRASRTEIPGMLESTCSRRERQAIRTRDQPLWTGVSALPPQLAASGVVLAPCADAVGGGGGGGGGSVEGLRVHSSQDAGDYLGPRRRWHLLREAQRTGPTAPVSITLHVRLAVGRAAESGRPVARACSSGGRSHPAGGRHQPSKQALRQSPK